MVLFVKKVEQANLLVEKVLNVGGMFEEVSPLSRPVTQVTLSNVLPFISDESLCVELSRHGKSVCPIKHVLSGYRSPLLKHVFSHRRQVYMILNNRGEGLEVRLHVKVDGFVYVLSVSSAAMKGKYK